MLGTISEGIMKWKAARTMEHTGRATTVAVCSRKGGVGKTTTTVHLAVAAARWHARRVLIIDMDPQGHILTALSNSVRPGGAQPLSSVFMDKKGDILDACLPTDLPNLWVVPADRRLEEIQMMLSSRIGREFVLKGMMAKAEDMFDLIIIDCPPNLDTLTLNSLVASHQVVVPTDLSLLAIEGVADISNAVETIRERLNLPVEVAGIMVVKVDARNKVINRELTKMLEARFGGLVMETRIPTNTALPRACLQGVTAYDFAPQSSGAKAYGQAVEELFDRIEA
jgi:chromosome partitioning protein